jgi:tRNA A-37 threonylcarbamoyl transferase component Bud32
MEDIQSRLHDALRERYRLERQLGRGGMATVFLAHDLKHRRKVAIKVLHPELAAVLGTERFLREIEIAAGLSHPHILPLHDSGEAAGLLYYVMPFVDGESLRERLSRERQLPVTEALNIARGVLRALGHAHQYGIIHRDIKPENILLSGGEPVVADFGIARAIEAGGEARMTQTGLAIGTAGYMSPEQAAGEKQLDARSDIYSLACVLYEMLAGEPPFTGPNAQAILAKRLGSAPPSLLTVRETVPPAVAQAVVRGLARHPADRFATASQFAAALESVPAETIAQPVHRTRKRWLIPALLVLVAAAGAVLWRRGATPASSIPPSALLIAVFPLVPTADTSLIGLGRDLAATLSANLDGVAEIRTVDRLTMLAQVDEGRSSPSLEEAGDLARRFGALSLVRGSVVRAGDSVRVDLGLYTTDSLSLVAQSQVTGSPHDLAALTDSLTWSLLRQVWRTQDPPTPSLAAVTTRSVPALRAFLEGERDIVRSRWRPAADAFARAIEADSSFWLAYWRYAYVREWEFEEVDRSIVEAYRSHRALLPEQDRRLIEVSMTDSVTVQFERLRRITRDFPDFWPGWMQYADWMVHLMPPLGATNAEAAIALERTVELNPALAGAWDHLAWMALARRDTTTLARCLAALDRLGVRKSIIEGTGVDLVLLYNFVAEELRSQSALSKPVADSVVRMMVEAREPFWQALFAGLFLSYGLPREQIGISRRLLRAGVEPEVASLHRRAIAFAWAARGAWDSALVAIDDYARNASLGRAAIDAYGLAAMAVWLSALEPATATQRRPAAIRAAGDVPKHLALVLWHDGMLAAARRDSPGIRTARSAIERLPDSGIAVLATSLAGLELELSAEPARAGLALAELEWTRAQPQADSAPWPQYVTAVNRFTASRRLLQSGDTTEAGGLLAWHQAWIGPSEEGPINKMLSSLGYLEQARIEQARGWKDMAREYYRLFLARYDLPVPRHRHLVTEARQALAQLAGPD